MGASVDPIIIDYVRPRDWRQLCRAALLLDLSEGDHFDYDARMGGINLWCSPEDRPAGWPCELTIVADPRDVPRAFVGRLTYDWLTDDWGAEPIDWATEETWPVRLQIRIPAVLAWHRATAGHLRHDDPAARVEGDEAWCRRQWQRLKQYAEVGTVQERAHDANNEPSL